MYAFPCNLLPSQDQDFLCNTLWTWVLCGQNCQDQNTYFQDTQGVPQVEYPCDFQYNRLLQQASRIWDKGQPLLRYYLNGTYCPPCLFCSHRWQQQDDDSKIKIKQYIYQKYSAWIYIWLVFSQKYLIVFCLRLWLKRP